MNFASKKMVNFLKHKLLEVNKDNLLYENDSLSNCLKYLSIFNQNITGKNIKDLK